MARCDGSILQTGARDFFWGLYDQLAETGVCDSPGGIEFEQVFADWFEAGADRETAEQFIRERANRSGWFEADGTPLPAERVITKSREE